MLRAEESAGFKVCLEVSATETEQRYAVFHRSEAPSLQSAALDSPADLAHKEIHYEEDMDDGFDSGSIVWIFECVCAALVHRAAWKHGQQFGDALGQHVNGEWHGDGRARQIG